MRRRPWRHECLSSHTRTRRSCRHPRALCRWGHTVAARARGSGWSIAASEARVVLPARDPRTHRAGRASGRAPRLHFGSTAASARRSLLRCHPCRGWGSHVAAAHRAQPTPAARARPLKNCCALGFSRRQPPSDRVSVAVLGVDGAVPKPGACGGGRRLGASYLRNFPQRVASRDPSASSAIASTAG